MVQDLLASTDVKVNATTMIKGRSKLDAETVVHDRRIASKRIPVETIIGYAETFQILKKTINSEQTCMGGRIIFVCFIRIFPNLKGKQILRVFLIDEHHAWSVVLSRDINISASGVYDVKMHIKSKMLYKTCQ